MLRIEPNLKDEWHENEDAEYYYKHGGIYLEYLVNGVLGGEVLAGKFNDKFSNKIKTLIQKEKDPKAFFKNIASSMSPEVKKGEVNIGSIIACESHYSAQNIISAYTIWEKQHDHKLQFKEYVKDKNGKLKRIVMKDARKFYGKYKNFDEVFPKAKILREDELEDGIYYLIMDGGNCIYGVKSKDASEENIYNNGSLYLTDHIDLPFSFGFTDELDIDDSSNGNRILMALPTSFWHLDKDDKKTIQATEYDDCLVGSEVCSESYHDSVVLMVLFEVKEHKAFRLASYKCKIYGNIVETKEFYTFSEDIKEDDVILSTFLKKRF